MIQKFEEFINESENDFEVFCSNLPFEWKRYVQPNGKFPKELPPQLLKIINQNKEKEETKNPWRSGKAKWYKDMIFYKGDSETTNHWIFICSDGAYFKVGAKYSIWATRAHKTDGTLYLGCERGPMSNLIDELKRYYFY